MKPPTIKCTVCQEFVFGKPKNTKKPVVCQQCRFAANAKRKFVGVGAALWSKRSGRHHNRAPGGNIVKAIIAVLLLSSASYAAENRLVVKVLGNEPLAEITSFSSAKVGSTGLGFGVEYLRQVKPRLAVGIEVDKLGRGDVDSAYLVMNAKSKLTSSVLAALAIARYDFRPDSKVRPYFTAGYGLAVVNLKVDVTPNPGFTWAGGATGTKTIIDSQGVGGVWTARAGADVAVTDRLAVGLEAGYLRTTKITHDLTADGNAAFSNGSTKGADSAFLFGASVGYRF